MSRLPQLDAWLASLTSAFGHLWAAEVRGLAWFSFGIVLARSCSVSAVAAQLAEQLGQKFDTVKQRLREWYCEADAKAGSHRKELDVRTGFAPLRRWVLADWPSKRLALALDATTLGQRFVSLAVSVLYQGCAVPVAWKILPALEKHPGKDEWLTLLDELGRALPGDWQVIVLAERGLYAKWLLAAIVRQGWHPFLRVNSGGTFRPQGQKQRRPFVSFVPQLGSQWQGSGEAFGDAKKRLRCTLLARWDPGYADPWLVLTDLPPEAAQVGWYALRAWIEQGFKRLGSGGWDWQKTRRSDPRRAFRLWLVLAVATWWCLRVGGEAEADVAVETVGALPRQGVARPAAAATAKPARPGRPQSARGIRVFVLGRVVILNTLVREGKLRLGRVIAQPWPTQVPTARTRGSPAA